MCELKCSLFLYLPFLLLWSLSTDLRRRGAWSGDKHEMSDSADLQLTTDRSYSEERRRRPLEMDWESEGGALPPSWDVILQVGFISLWWEKCSYFVLSCISKFSSSNYCHVLPHLTVPLSSFAKKCIFPD